MRFLSFPFFLLAFSTPAFTAVCDYRPSEIIGGNRTALTVASTGGVAATGAGANAVGVYTLVHATSGLTMVGGTWAGASAAGTAGIIGGTGGLIGSTVAIVTAPATIIVAGALGTTIAVIEGACYFTDTRITDYEEIDALLANIALTAPRDLFQYRPTENGQGAGQIWVQSEPGSGRYYDRYNIADLYIVNGVLKASKIGPDSTIGLVAVIGQASGGQTLEEQK